MVFVFPALKSWEVPHCRFRRWWYHPYDIPMIILAVWWTVWLFHPRCTDDDDDGDDGCDDDDDDNDDDDEDEDDDDDDDDDTSWHYFIICSKGVRFHQLQNRFRPSLALDKLVITFESMLSCIPIISRKIVVSSTFLVRFICSSDLTYPSPAVTDRPLHTRHFEFI